MSFLNKANQDLDDGRNLQKAQTQQDFKTTDQGVEVPKVLRDVVEDTFYVSDADEAFVPVALKWEGGKLPDEGMLLLFNFMFVIFRHWRD